MNQDNESRFHCSKKQYLSEKKFVQRGSPEKNIPAQAVSEKKISCKPKNLKYKADLAFAVLENGNRLVKVLWKRKRSRTRYESAMIGAA